jgi:hypothetical protein
MAARTLSKLIEPKSVTVRVELPALTVCQLVGVSPTPHWSAQWKL